MLNEKRSAIYTVFSKIGYYNDYTDKEDLGVYKFTAPDDFHAYVFILMTEVLQDNSEFDINDPEDFEECLKYLEDEVFHQKITEKFIKDELAHLENSKYTRGRPWAEVYWIKRSGKVIDEFHTPSVSSTRGVEVSDYRY